MRKKSVGKTTLEKIKRHLHVRYAIAPRAFIDTESFTTLGIAPSQMHHFLTGLQSSLEVNIDWQRCDTFDVDSPLKLAHWIDRHSV